MPPRDARRQSIQSEAEIITYVREGTLAYEDSAGRSGLISAGEFQRMTAGHAIHFGATNTSPTRWAHVFQIWLNPPVLRIEPGHEQTRFSTAERHGVLCVVASPDGQKGSLRLHQDVFLLSTILDRGQHVIRELSAGRCAWVHIVQGAVRCGELDMRAGDGAGIEAEPAVSLRASETTEVLILDLSEQASATTIDEGRSG